MSRRLRGVVRIARATIHGLHGLAIVMFAFPRLDVATRYARIRWWSVKMLRVLGIGHIVDGVAPVAGGLLVANHVSWLDIMAVHAVVPEVRFVSKADVKAWPLVARLVDAGSTLYLERERKRDALRVVHVVAESLAAGQTVAIFPEGTTSSGHGLLPFHANLLQAPITSATLVQPIALRYSESANAVSEAVEFVGRTTMLESLWQDGLRRRHRRAPRVPAPARGGRGRAARARVAAARRHRLPRSASMNRRASTPSERSP